MIDYKRLAERAFIYDMITNKYPTGIVSLVSDTFDFWAVITEDARILKNIILARKPDALGNAKTVFRPDSGDPVNIICGDPEAEPGTPAYKGAVECLWEIFGGTETAKGFKVLDSHVGLIYGDSITLSIAHKILAGLAANGFASCNIVFGIGSFTYQCVTRDSYGTAIKATYGVVNGEPRELFKKPKTDNGMKFSARGLLRIEREGDDWILYERQTPEQEEQGELRVIFENSKMFNLQGIKEIRERLHSGKF